MTTKLWLLSPLLLSAACANYNHVPGSCVCAGVPKGLMLTECCIAISQWMSKTSVCMINWLRADIWNVAQMGSWQWLWARAFYFSLKTSLSLSLSFAWLSGKAEVNLTTKQSIIFFIAFKPSLKNKHPSNTLWFTKETLCMAWSGWQIPLCMETILQKQVYAGNCTSQHIWLVQIQWNIFCNAEEWFDAMVQASDLQASSFKRCNFPCWSSWSKPMSCRSHLLVLVQHLL